MNKTIIGLTLIIVMILTGCSQLSSAGMIKSEKLRIKESSVSQSDLTTLKEGNGLFAFNLYQSLRESDGNIFYSPYSISLALAMTYAGARGETEKQMEKALSYLLPQDVLHPAFNSLDMRLVGRGESTREKNNEGFHLNVVNAIWGQKDYIFLSEYLDVLAENYGAGLRILDFIKESEKSRITINNWVSDQTESRIEDLIPQGAINPLTRLVLTNAIYFNSAWLYPFEKEATSDGSFILLEGTTVNIPMMNRTESFGYVKGEIFQAIELPYAGNAHSMVILLPDRDRFNEFEESLSYDIIKEILSEIKNHHVNLQIPKFEYDSEFKLREVLASMGMPIAFSTDADFSGMTDNKGLFIDEVIHKAFVSVEEAGTEAAAATAIIMKGSSSSDEPVSVSVTRPFIFIIRDIETGAILFVGRVLNPSI